MSFFDVWRYLENNYSIYFHGRGTELLKIYSSMAGRVGNIKNISVNNFKIVKSTKNIKINRNHEFKAVFSIKKILIFRNFIFPTLPPITAWISCNLVPLLWKFQKRKNVQKDVVWRYMCILFDSDDFCFRGYMYVCVYIYISTLHISETNQPIFVG